MRVPSKDPKIAADYPRPTAKEFRAHRSDWTDPFFGVHTPIKDPGNPARDELTAKLRSIDGEPMNVLRALGFAKGQEPKEDKKWREILKYDQLEQDKEDAPHGGVFANEKPDRDLAPYTPYDQRAALAGASPVQANRPQGVAELIGILGSLGVIPASSAMGPRMKRALGIKGDYLGRDPAYDGYKADAEDWK